MSKGGVNKVILLGRLGQDPEFGVFPSSGTEWVSLSLATSDQWKDKTTGEPVKHTEWHRVKFTGKAAGVLNAFAKKGDQLYVEGALRTRKYQDNNGSDRYVTEIIGSEFRFITSQVEREDKEATAPAAARPPAGNKKPAPAAPVQAALVGGADFDDDIPFREVGPEGAF